MLRAEGTPLTGHSLPGLSVGLRTQVQAGESVQGPAPSSRGDKVTPRLQAGGGQLGVTGGSLGGLG